jgi:hypothetical protein
LKLGNSCEQGPQWATEVAPLFFFSCQPKTKGWAMTNRFYFFIIISLTWFFAVNAIAKPLWPTKLDEISKKPAYSFYYSHQNDKLIRQFPKYKQKATKHLWSKNKKVIETPTEEPRVKPKKEKKKKLKKSSKTVTAQTKLKKWMITSPRFANEPINSAFWEQPQENLFDQNSLVLKKSTIQYKNKKKRVVKKLVPLTDEIDFDDFEIKKPKYVFTNEKNKDNGRLKIKMRAKN